MLNVGDSKKHKFYTLMCPLTTLKLQWVHGMNVNFEYRNKIEGWIDVPSFTFWLMKKWSGINISHYLWFDEYAIQYVIY